MGKTLVKLQDKQKLTAIRAHEKMKKKSLSRYKKNRTF